MTTNTLAKSIQDATDIAQRIGGATDDATADVMLDQLAAHADRHPGQGPLISCQVFALYQVVTTAQTAGDHTRAGQVLAQLGTVLAAIPDDQDVTVGATPDGQALTGRNLMMTTLLGQIVLRRPDIDNFDAAMAWMQVPHADLQNTPPLDHVRRLDLRPVLALL